jgi:hypothetical protein
MNSAALSGCPWLSRRATVHRNRAASTTLREVSPPALRPLISLCGKSSFSQKEPPGPARDFVQSLQGSFRRQSFVSAPDMPNGCAPASLPSFSASSHSFASISFRIRTSKNLVHNSFTIRTSKTRNLKSFRIRTSAKTCRGDTSLCGNSDSLGGGSFSSRVSCVLSNGLQPLKKVSFRNHTDSTPSSPCLLAFLPPFFLCYAGPFQLLPGQKRR